MKAIIIDDEKKARHLLRMMLEENCPAIGQIEEAADLPSGARLIRSLRPDIVFLDIEMPGYSGTQILDFISPEEVDFELIFTTAYSEFALKAFDLNAIDYLLKPLQEEKLIRAVDKVVKKGSATQNGRNLTELNNTFQAGQFQKIGLPQSTGTLFIEIPHLIMLQADRMYTRVFTTQPAELLVSKPLKYFLDLLDGVPGFYQPHRSYLVNLQHIREYSTRNGGQILLDHDLTASLSREKKDEFLQLMGI
ncbi:MAG: response regulator transcription factor [Bacteroidia bacterium]|nr:response regulator transcription factor [Bacteroidia bacterium]